MKRWIYASNQNLSTELIELRTMIDAMESNGRISDHRGADDIKRKIQRLFSDLEVVKNMPQRPQLTPISRLDSGLYAFTVAFPDRAPDFYQFEGLREARESWLLFYDTYGCVTTKMFDF